MTRVPLRSPFARGRHPVVAIAIALSVAACGSGSLRSPGATTASAKNNGVADKSPAQIITAAQTALRSANGFVAAGTLTSHGKAMRVKIIDGGRSKLDLSMRQGGQAAEIRLLSGLGYLRANAAFWAAHSGGSATSPFANHWIEFPVAASKKLASSLGQFAPGTLARCLGEDHGTLSRAGTTTVDGQPAVVVHDAGNVPGDNPGTLAVATTGPPYPLRLTSTGPARPGGKVDVCNDGKGGDSRGSLTLSHFGHVPAITAPANPLRINSPSRSI